MSFEEFFANDYDHLVRVAALICGDPALAEDLTQDALVAVHRRYHELDDPRAYARRCIVNGAHDLHRRKGRWDARVHLLAASPTVTPEHRDLADALGALPLPQRTALVLRYFAANTDTEVADAMGVPLGTAKSHLRRGLDELRKVVER